MSIKIKNLYKSYNNKSILENFNLEIPKGKIFGLLGPNGVGKTTLISILNYLIQKDKGDIEICSFDYEKEKNKIKSISSYIPQNYAFYPNLTTYENLEFFAALYGLKNKELKKRIDYCLEMTSLENFIDNKIHTLSGGVKRRLNIAIGLLNSPQIIYLDEPTVGIDSHSRKHILNMIKNLNREKSCTIVYTSHYMEEVAYLCDEIAILDKKNILLQGKKDDLLKKESIVNIKLKDKNIKIDTSNSYVHLLEVLKNLKNDEVLDIHFESKNLEDIFLELIQKSSTDV